MPCARDASLVRLRRHSVCIGYYMNVFIVKRDTRDVIARYEVHKAGDKEQPPPDREYFETAWQRAIGDRLVEPEERRSYDFLMQPPKNLY